MVRNDGRLDRDNHLDVYNLPFRPLAPLAAWRASSKTTFRLGSEDNKLYEMLAPLTPDPTMTTSA